MADENPRRKRRAPAKISARYLQWVTTRYFERYATSRSHLRRLLMQRVGRSVAHHGGDLEEPARLVDAELDRLERLGLLDDARYAADRARVLHRRGASRTKIRAALLAKGLSSEHVDGAIDGVGTELEAAAKWARKRRIGPWRRDEVDRDGRRKELARMGRAGFSYELARRIVDAEDAADLES